MNFASPEGATPLDPDEIVGLLPALSTQEELNEFEADNIVAGALWARDSRLVKSSLLELSTLRRIHLRMFDRTWRWAGQFRTTQKNIGCESWKIGTLLKELADDVKTWVEFESFSPAEIAARFHHRLVLIHPFPNGNGRFARLVTDLLCEQQGWPVSLWGLADPSQQQAVREAYIWALRAADGNDFSPLITFMYPGH